jgi:UPF0716 protein FxsA
MPALLLIGFVCLETWGVLQALHRFGGIWVLAWLIGAAIIGVWLMRRGGMQAFASMRYAVARGELPPPQVFEGLVTAFAGLLLILPGFCTDLIAISLLIGGAGLRKRLGSRLSATVQRARPDLRQPVTLDGEYRRRS